MIFFFSGTGNSRYVAEELGQRLDEETYFIPDIDATTLSLDNDGQKNVKDIGFIFPVYSWGVPPIVENFILNLSDTFIDEIKKRNLPVWMVCTCGDETGDTPEMFRGIMRKRGLGVKGIWSVITPNVYVLLPGFDVDTEEVRIKKIELLENRLDDISEQIKRGEWKEDVVLGSMPRLKTRLVYPLFKRWGIFPSKWRAGESCIQCGKCVETCPVGNITMKHGKPLWGNNCTSCVACYHTCPTNAISYSTVTRNKGQYLPSQRPKLHYS